MKIPSISIRQMPGRQLSWEVSWRDPARPGVKARKRRRYFATEAEAVQFRADFEAALRTAPSPQRPAMQTTAGTVAAYLASWLNVHIKPKRDAATYRSYESLVRVHIVPAPMADGATFGDLSMAGLRRLTVRTFYEDLHERKVPLPTRRHVHSCLSSACGRAVEDEVLDSNPCLTLGRNLWHKGEPRLDPEPNPFTREQAKVFLVYVEKHERNWLEYFQFLHDTGVRVGELAALKWSSVDLKQARAEIVASYSPSDNADKAPKTHQRRWIDLSDLVVEQLTASRKRQRVETLKAGRTTREYVFTNRRGSPRRQDGNMRRVFDRVVAACALGDHTPHDLRDTFATIHLSDNYMKLPWVSRQLGHETERTTVDHYFRFLPSTYTKKFANEIR